MKVWVVEELFPYEPGNVIGVASSDERGKAMAEEYVLSRFKKSSSVPEPGWGDGSKGYWFWNDYDIYVSPYVLDHAEL